MSKRVIRAGAVLVGCLVLALIIFFGSIAHDTGKEWTYAASDRLHMPFLCDLILLDFGNDVRQCREAYALKYQDVAACGRHDYCYTRYFEQYPTIDATACDTVSNAVLEPQLGRSKQSICKTSQNGVVHNIEICQSMNSSSSRDGCFMGQATFKGDASICKKYITNVRFLAYCYVGVATKIKDPSLCEFQPDAWLKDQCIKSAQ